MTSSDAADERSVRLFTTEPWQLNKTESMSQSVTINETLVKNLLFDSIFLGGHCLSLRSH
jgi:hypothetical protein